MTQLAQQISSLKVAPGSVGVFWLGQAGFALKTSRDRVIYIDAYLSEYCQRMPGNEIAAKRIFPAPLAVSEVTNGLVIATHAHEDHVDPEIVRFASVNSPDVVFAGSASSVRMMKGFGAPSERTCLLKEGSRCDFDGFFVRAVYADHGDDEPDAIGVVIETDGIRIYHTGDTSYCPEKMTEVIALKPDIIMPCINGAFGNLNGIEAARLANDVGAKVAIPSHFWLFVCQNITPDGTPAAFLDGCRQFAPNTEAVILAVGESYIYERR